MYDDSKLNNVLIGILYLVLGVVFISSTEELIKGFNYVMVCICAVIGVIQIIGYFFNKKYKSNNYIEIIMGVVFIWISLVLYVYYGFMINILPILFSLYLFIMGSSLFIKYLNIKKIKYLLLGIFAIIIGILLIFNPSSIILTYLKVTGIYLSIVGVIYLYEVVRTLIKK